jgi:tetratricopeptide (TPR) repeat protein
VGELGYLDHALEDFDACLAIDPAYLNCQQWRAEALLGLGRVQEAVAQFEATLPDNFHSASDAFVSYYVRTGQKTRAYLVASLAMRLQFAPIRDWVAAIEDPTTRPTAIARFEEWGQAHNLGICDMDMVAVALGREDCYTQTANVRMMWQPDTAAFRQTPAFKAWVNEHAMAFWHAWGFPPQCRDLGDGEFECD